MAEDVVHLTQEGFDKLESELEDLRTVRRREVAERLRQALEEGGDLQENAEYADAKNDQAFVEGRIQELEMWLSRAQIIEPHEVDGIVHLDSKVTVQEDGYEKETFHIVGAQEANPAEGKISNVSPLGRALMGRAKGDSVTIAAPDGDLIYTILKID